MTNPRVERRILERTPSYVDVVFRYRLWAVIPEWERVTADEIRAKFAEAAGYAPFVAERFLGQLDGEGCVVATRRTEFRNRYLRCGGEVAQGVDLCAVHGGKTARIGRERYEDVRAERDALRSELDRLTDNPKENDGE